MRLPSDGMTLEERVLDLIGRDCASTLAAINGTLRTQRVLTGESHETERMIDRALQRLRRRGAIRFVNKAWRIA